MLRNARELLSETEVRRCTNKTNVAHVPINKLENIRIFGQRAADTEGGHFGTQLELFIHIQNEIDQILWRSAAFLFRFVFCKTL